MSKREMEARMVKELQGYLDEIHKARKSGDAHVESHWNNKFYCSWKFVQAVTGKVVNIRNGKIRIEEA